MYILITLKFSVQCAKAAAKANSVLGLIKRTSTFSNLSQDIFTKLYKSVVCPHLEYGSCIWSPRLKRDIEIIERVQRRAKKLVPGLTHVPYHERLIKLGLPTLAYRRARFDMIEVFKLLNGYDGSSLCTRCDMRTLNRWHV